MKSIDLGRKSEGPCCVTSAPSPKDEPTVYYPSLYVDGSESLSDLPDEGTMTVKFKVTSRSSTDRNGKKTSSIAIDVLKILDAEASPSNEKSRESTLDDLAAEEASEE